MPKELFNEGRVVGLDGYSLYVKQHLTEDPDTPPVTEREWLAATLGSGMSLILQVPNVAGNKDSHNIVDIQLPENTRLGACSTILCQFFEGEAAIKNNWATHVTSYGEDLIANTDELHPSGVKGENDEIEHQDPSDMSGDKIKQLRDYLKIIDGVIIQPGKWDTSDVTPPAMDLSVDLGKKPRVRLHVKGSITSHPLLLLTGFNIRSILLGTSGQDGSNDTPTPEDGDFLGPAVYPWASKITFVVPSSYVSYFASGNLKRTITPGDTSAQTVDDTPVIDMKTGSGDGQLQAPVAENYYRTPMSTDKLFYKNGKSKTDSRVSDNVESHATLGDGSPILTVYARSSLFPPALYSTYVSEDGQNYLHPLDTVAPGTIKMFNNADKDTLQNYENTFPGTNAMNKNSDGTIQVLDENNNMISIADITEEFIGNFEYDRSVYAVPNNNTISNATGDQRPKVLKLSVGKKSVYLLELSNGIATDNAEPTQKAFPVQSPSGSVPLNDNANNEITWNALIYALAQGVSLDLLGDRLKSAKDTLIANEGYLEFGPENDKLRLYISDTAPSTSGVPIGSIGIGWGFTQES